MLNDRIFSMESLMCRLAKEKGRVKRKEEIKRSLYAFEDFYFVCFVLELNSKHLGCILACDVKSGPCHGYFCVLKPIQYSKPSWMS